MKQLIYTVLLSFFCIKLSAQPQDYQAIDKSIKDIEDLRLHHKLIPLSNTVYPVLEYLESSGLVQPLPMAKPYTRIIILNIMHEALTNPALTQREYKMIKPYIEDLSNGSNSIRIYQSKINKNYSIIGFSANTKVGTGLGDVGTWTTSLVAEPFVSGDLGNNVTFCASAGPAFERLAPDFFKGSYTKDGVVNFPYQNVGYAALPYQFDYNTMWSHVNVPEFTETSPIHQDLTAALIYHTELNASWFNNALQVNIHNRRRAWGHDMHNLVLASTARSFPAVEFKLEPTSWLRYSYLTGSLFSYESQSNRYEHIYGYDLGQKQTNFTNHLLELILWRRLNLAVGGSNIWSKRMEMAYMVPFVVPHLTQIDVGDHDNLTLYFSGAYIFPHLGKIWGDFFVDEFGWEGNGALFKRPRNRYAWQVGWQHSLLRQVLPGTKGKLMYTRVTPYVYTHYTESDFNPTGSDRPIDMTYTHDGSNLGFYLPTNSSEWQFELINIAIPNLMVKFDARYIRHGTNDLSNTEVNLNYGDIYRIQMHNVLDYPQMDFTNDGIYDHSTLFELSFDWRIRHLEKYVRYYRLKGSIGYGTSWWESNQSGVTAPASKNIITASLGVVVDM